MQNTIISKGFIFDMNKCVGCQACTFACSIENNNGIPFHWRNIYTSNNLNYSQAPLFHLSLACNHCEKAPCIKGCPTNAYSRDENTNAVIIDEVKCIGCNYCSWVCPYDAPKLNYDTGIMQKCTLCIDRLEKGKNPACSTNCPVGALEFEIIPDLENKEFENYGISPNIVVIPLKENKQIPEMDISMVKPKNKQEISIAPEYDEKIKLKHEWGLLFFTFIIAILFAYFNIFFDNWNDSHQIFFIGLAGIGMAFSLLHLNKPLKAYRAVFNVRNSWLSREIMFFVLFIFLSFISYFIEVEFIRYLSAFCGFFCLVSIDILYRNIAFEEKRLFRTGSTILISFYLILLFTTHAFFYFLVARNILYLIYKLVYLLKGQRINIYLILTRVVFGFVFPILFLDHSFNLLIICVLVGELIERIEFYLSLNLITPKKQIEKDLVYARS